MAWVFVGWKFWWVLLLSCCFELGLCGLVLLNACVLLFAFVFWCFCLVCYSVNSVVIYYVFYVWFGLVFYFGLVVYLMCYRCCFDCWIVDFGLCWRFDVDVVILFA